MGTAICPTAHATPKEAHEGSGQPRGAQESLVGFHSSRCLDFLLTSRLKHKEKCACDDGCTGGCANRMRRARKRAPRLFFLHSHDAWGLRSVSTEVSMAHINETNDDYFDEGADMGTAIRMMHGFTSTKFTYYYRTLT